MTATASADARIFIVLATYNGARFLPAQLTSIQAQSITSWTLLVRDDGSTDGTLALLKTAVHDDARIELVDDQSGTLGASGNFGRLASIAYERGADRLFFADQDDVWRADKLARLLSAIDERERSTSPKCPVLAYSDLRLIDDTGGEIAASFMQFQRIRHEPDDPLRMLVVQNFVTGCATAINRALLALALPIPEAVPMHDWWCAVVAAAAGVLTFVPETTIAYRRHGSNTVAVRGFWRTLNPLRTDWRAVWSTGRQTQDRTVAQAGELLQRLRERGHGSAPAIEPLSRYVALWEATSAIARLSSAHRLRLRSQTWPRTLALYLRFAAGPVPHAPP